MSINNTLTINNDGSISNFMYSTVVTSLRVNIQIQYYTGVVESFF